jgi:hypothetical protein
MCDVKRLGGCERFAIGISAIKTSNSVVSHMKVGTEDGDGRNWLRDSH